MYFIFQHNFFFRAFVVGGHLYYIMFFYHHNQQNSNQFRSTFSILFMYLINNFFPINHLPRQEWPPNWSSSGTNQSSHFSCSTHYLYWSYFYYNWIKINCTSIGLWELKRILRITRKRPRYRAIFFLNKKNRFFVN